MFSAISDKISDIFEGLIQFLFDSFLGPFLGLDSLEGLIFGKPESMKDETVIWNTFAQSDIDGAFYPLYNTVTGIAGSFFIIAIVLAGMRISSSGYNPARRNEIFEFSKEVILVGIGFFYLPTLYDLLFSINSGIVNYFSDASNYETLNASSDLSELDKGDEETGLLGKIFIQLILLGLSLWASFYYMMRRITLLILMAMGPLMMVFWMVPQFKSMTGAWFKELIGSIYVQSIHAFVFFVVGVLSQSSSGLISTIIVYVVFIPISESIRGLLGMGGGMQGGLSKAGAMFGMSALAGMAGAVKGAMDGRSVTGTLKSMARGVSESRKGSTEEGMADADTSASFADTQASKMLGVGSFVSKAGKAVLGSAGAIAGSGLGPAGAIAGAEIGAKLGEVGGGLTGRVGAAAALGLANRINDGKKALQDLKASQGNEDEVITNALANEQATNWANNNRESVMNKLREDFPSATPQDLEKKFNDMKAAKLNSFKENASKHWTSAKGIANNIGDGNALVGASASSMATQWANDNREQFMSDFESKNPRNAGESIADYNNRKNQAFNERVSQMKDNFISDGNKFVHSMGGTTGQISRTALANFMGSAAGEHQNAGNIENLTEAATSGMEHVQGVAMFSKAGKPNMSAIVNSLASVKTHQQGDQYIRDRIASGVSEQQAQTEWQQQERRVLEQNVQSYNKPSFQNSIASMVNPLPKSKVQSMIQSSSAFASGSLNVPGMKNMVNRVGMGVVSGAKSFGTSMNNGEIFKAVPNAVASGVQGVVNEHIKQFDGDAVAAHHEVSRSVGYATGVVFGASGMKMANKLMNKIGSYSQPVQQQISSPSEVLQMAHKVLDDNGIERIPQGAIRQVITRDASYVEVRTNSGEVRTVSRFGAGNKTLKSGETMYQDLISHDGVSLTTTPSKGGSTLYRMDSGGSRVPVQGVFNQENPMNLLGNPVHPVHAPVQRKEIPVLNQKVDMGNFYVEDLKKMEMGNIQVVVDKGRQFVTAEREGVTYRVSPIMNGNGNLDSNQTITVPVAINKGRLKPLNIVSDVSMEGQSTTQAQTTEHATIVQNIKMPNNRTGERKIIQRNIQVLGETSEATSGTYFDENLVSGLIKSKYDERATRLVERRRHLDIVRRKQGF